jgi:hypothetical protein
MEIPTASCNSLSKHPINLSLWKRVAMIDINEIKLRPSPDSLIYNLPKSCCSDTTIDNNKNTINWFTDTINTLKQNNDTDTNTNDNHLNNAYFYHNYGNDNYDDCDDYDNDYDYNYNNYDNDYDISLCNDNSDHSDYNDDFIEV